MAMRERMGYFTRQVNRRCWRGRVRQSLCPINERKGRVQRAAGRQEVTGIVVNAKLGLPRSEVRRLRAILHASLKTGLSAQNRNNHPNFRAYLEGKIGYLMMVDEAKGKAMRADLLKVRDSVARS
jgi:RNA-directed DNA polymerase